MKKAIILVIAIALIPLAEALTLFGEEISMLVIIPSILILVFLVGFIFMIVRDKIKSKPINTSLNLESLPEPASAESLGGELPSVEKPLQEMPQEKTPEKAAPLNIPGQQKPKTNYLDGIESLEKGIHSTTIGNTHKKLNDLIKNFFSDYADIKYNFTFEELEKELKKKNKGIQCFSDSLSSINYSPKGISKVDLIELISEFKDIIQTAKEENMPTTPEFQKEIKKEEKKINVLLRKGEKLIKKDIQKAKEKYNEIFKLYSKLPNHEKKPIRQSIMEFYKQLG